MRYYHLELEFEHGFIEVLVEYEYEPGSPGSYDEPPDGDEISIKGLKIIGKDLEDFEQFLLEYEREGGGRYNPADDR